MCRYGIVDMIESERRGVVMKNGIPGLREKDSIPKPPYFQQGSGVTLLYSLPVHRFNQALPGFLETYPNRKRVWFAIDVLKWEKSFSKHAPGSSHPHIEVIYGVWVKFNGRLGQHPMKSYLNDTIGIEWGRYFYATPKYLANISIDKTTAKLHARASRDGEKVLELDVKPRRFIGNLLSPLLNAYIGRLQKRYVGLYNFRKEDNAVIRIPVTLKNKVSLGKVNQAYFKEPIEWGILTEQEVLKPSYVFLWGNIDMDISPPEITRNPWNESWRSGFGLSFKQFKYTEAIVKDDEGREYGLAMSMLGNPVMYGEYAWITDGDRWL